LSRLASAILLAATIGVSAPTADAAESFTVPTPRVIEMLRKQHDARDWLFVTTPAGRYEVRVGEIEDGGLSGISARRGTPPTNTWAWSDVARIEQRRSHFALGQFIGLTLGAIAGGFAGAAVGDNNPNLAALSNEQAAIFGAVAGGVAGAWGGGAIGDRFESANPWYFGRPASGDFAPLATGTNSDEALHQYQSDADAGDLLRLRGTFGEFVGSAATVDPSGFSGLTRDEGLDLESRVPVEPIAWSNVVSVERRVGSSCRYAVIGALVGGILGAFVGGVSAGGGDYVLSSDGYDDSVETAVVKGASVMGCVGGVIGAMFGSGIPRWELVYRAPALAQNSASGAH